jgi:glycosyltransferase involved in cell wall biosynthesis
MPVISVIIAVHNAACTLQQCLDSVAAQTYPHVELIVMDGGSSDGTVDLLKKNAAVITNWRSEPDTGIYNAWNKALTLATGDWVCFLGADDYFWDAQALQHMADSLVCLPSDVRIVYGQVMLLGLRDAPLYVVGEPYARKPGKRVDVMGLPPHPGLMHRRTVFEERGGFDESFRIAGDAELLLREMQYSPVHFVPGVIVVGMRQGGISSKPANVLKSLQELRRIQRKHGIRWPGVAFTLARLRVFVRRILWGVMGERFTRRALDFGRKLLGKPAYWTRT